MTLPISPTKTETDFLKGVGITLIVFHNFFHVLPPNLGENEMSFNAHLVWDVLSAFLNDPSGFVKLLFSYFGHYGVEIFIYVSGYGLVKSYQSKGLSLVRFTATRFLKIYLILLVSVIVRLAINMARHLSWPDEDILTDMVGYLTLTNNLHTDTLLSGIGPWWFFGLILQLYLLFPFLYIVIDKYKIKGYLVIAGVTYFLLFALARLAADNHFPLYGNFIGHLPEFGLGMLFALIDKKEINLSLWLFASIVFLLSNFYGELFPVSFLAVTIFAVPPLIQLARHSPEAIHRFFVFIGVISLYLFIINAPVRRLLYPYAVATESALVEILYSLLHFAGLIALSTILLMGVSWVQRMVIERKYLPRRA